MTSQPLSQAIDPTPLVARLTEKPKTGKLAWESTADSTIFIASVGGKNTLKLTLESVEDWATYGYPEFVKVPSLHLLDEEGRVVWKVENGEVRGGLWELYKLAQRIGHKVDVRLADLMEVLERL